MAAISQTQPQGLWPGGTALQGESRVSVHPGAASVCDCTHCRCVSHCAGPSRVRPCLVSMALSERDDCYFYFLMRTQGSENTPKQRAGDCWNLGVLDCKVFPLLCFYRQGGPRESSATEKGAGSSLSWPHAGVILGKLEGARRERQRVVLHLGCAMTSPGML